MASAPHYAEQSDRRDRQAVPHSDYCSRLDGNIKWMRSHGMPIRAVAPIVVEDYVAWCAEHDEDPEEARAAHALHRINARAQAIDAARLVEVIVITEFALAGRRLSEFLRESIRSHIPYRGHMPPTARIVKLDSPIPDETAAVSLGSGLSASRRGGRHRVGRRRGALGRPAR